MSCKVGCASSSRDTELGSVALRRHRISVAHMHPVRNSTTGIETTCTSDKFTNWNTIMRTESSSLRVMTWSVQQPTIASLFYRSCIASTRQLFALLLNQCGCWQLEGLRHPNQPFPSAPEMHSPGNRPAFIPWLHGVTHLSFYLRWDKALDKSISSLHCGCKSCNRNRKCLTFIPCSSLSGIGIQVSRSRLKSMH